MSRLLRDFSILQRAAMANGHRHAFAWLCASGVFAALFVGALVLFKTDDLAGAAIRGIAAAFAVLMFGWMMYFVSGAVKLNTPANAQLVPRMRRRLMQLTVLAWGGAVGLATLLALLTLDTPAHIHLVFLCLGAWLISFGLSRSGHSSSNWIMFLFPVLFGFNRAIPREWLALLSTVPGFAVAALLMLAFGAFTLDTMFPRGGDRHYRLRAAQTRIGDLLTTQGQFKGERVPRVGLWIYEAALKQDGARRNAGALLMHVLGPAAHWTGRLLPMVSFVAITAGVMLALRRFASPDILEGVAGGFWIALSTVLLVPLFDCERRLMRLSFTRSEQCLVRLAPAMPGAAEAFNRRLATRFLLGGLGDWAIVSVGVLCGAALTGASAVSLWMQACLCCLTLPMLAANLRDHAHRSGSGGWLVILGLLLSAGLSCALGWLAQRLFGAPWLPAAAFASLVLAIAAVARGWRAAVDAPHAFPVGRLA